MRCSSFFVHFQIYFIESKIPFQPFANLKYFLIFLNIFFNLLKSVYFLFSIDPNQRYLLHHQQVYSAMSEFLLLQIIIRSTCTCMSCLIFITFIDLYLPGSNLMACKGMNWSLKESFAPVSFHHFLHENLYLEAVAYMNSSIVYLIDIMYFTTICQLTPLHIMYYICRGQFSQTAAASLFLSLLLNLFPVMFRKIFAVV